MKRANKAQKFTDMCYKVYNINILVENGSNYKLKAVAVTSLLPKLPSPKFVSKVFRSEKWVRAVLSVVPTFVTAFPAMAV